MVSDDDGNLMTLDDDDDDDDDERECFQAGPGTPGSWPPA